MGVAPMTRVGSLSSMVLTVQDFETALEGFVPISLRGLPLHTMGSVDFGHVGGLEKVKQQLRETLLWPSKVREGGREGGDGEGGRGWGGGKGRGREGQGEGGRGKGKREGGGKGRGGKGRGGKGRGRGKGKREGEREEGGRVERGKERTIKDEKGGEGSGGGKGKEEEIEVSPPPPPPPLHSILNCSANALSSRDVECYYMELLVQARLSSLGQWPRSLDSTLSA